MENYTRMDEGSLRKLLDTCTDFDERLKIRSAIRILRKPADAKQDERNKAVTTSVHLQDRRAVFQNGKSTVASRNDIKSFITSPYEGLDQDQLKVLLKNATDLDERVRIRSAIRKLKEGRTPERNYGLSPVQWDKRHDRQIDASSEVSSKSPSAHDTASESDSVSLPDCPEPDSADRSFETNGRASPLISPASGSAPPGVSADKYSHISSTAQLEDLLRRTVDYFEKKRIRARLQTLRQREAREHIRRRASMELQRDLSEEQLNNLRNSMEAAATAAETVETNESETKNGEILERLAETPNEDEETGDQTAEKREETLERLDQRLRCLEQEFEDCKDFDKRRQIRGDIKELRTRIRERKKTSSTTPSSSTSSVHQTTEKARDKSPERLISRASVIVSQVETPRQLTAVLENTAGDTEPRTDANDTRMDNAALDKSNRVESGGEAKTSEEKIDGDSLVLGNHDKIDAETTPKAEQRVKKKRLHLCISRDAAASSSASDSGGDAQSDLQAQYGVPELVAALQDRAAAEGDAVELSCLVQLDVDVPVTVKWFHGRQLVTNSDDYSQEFDGKMAKLTILSCEPGDEGVYSCVVRTTHGEAESKASLKVHKNTENLPPKVMLPLVDKTAIEGKSVTLECCISSDGTLQVEWYKDGRRVASEGRFAQMYDGQVAQLTVRGASRADAGRYRLVARGASGEVTSECDVLVKPQEAAPLFDRELHDVTVDEGDAVTLECWLRPAAPAPSVRWRHDDRELKNDADFRQTYEDGTARLVIRSTLAEDSGTYSCVASSDAGEAASSSRVTVRPAKEEEEEMSTAPAISKALTDLTVLDGEDVVFSCLVSGAPQPDIFWFRNDTKLSELSKDYVQKYDGRVASLRIDDVMTEDSARIRLVAQNAAGRAESCCRLRVKALSSEGQQSPLKSPPMSSPFKTVLSSKDKNKKPVFVVPLKDYEFEDGKPALLKCELDTSDDTDVNWFKDGRLLPDNSEFAQKFDGKVAMLDILEVFPDDAGKYVCEAENDFGLSKTSCVVTIIGSDSEEEKEDDTKRQQQDDGGMADINSINDEDELHKLLTKTEDFDERKKIRARMKEVREARAAAYEEQRAAAASQRESAVEMKQRQADAARKKALQDLDSKADEKRKSDKPSMREEAIKQRHANAAAEKQQQMKALEQKASYIKDAFSAGRDLVKKHAEPGTTEETTSTSTKTQTGKDGSTTTTTTTTTTRKTQDGSTVVTKQSKQITKVGGLGATTYDINKASADDTANRLSQVMSTAGTHGTSGSVHVKTESWRSKDGVERRTEKTQSWGPGQMGGGARPNVLAAPGAEAGGGGGGLVRSPSAIKQMLLEWTKQQTTGYNHVDIKNFSSSWNDGMAFCALIHSFYPRAFDYSKLDPKRRRANFTLAFNVAEKLADIAPLLDVDDMVRMKNPDWKCVFTYVQSFYRRFRMQENKNPDSPITPTTPQTPLSPEPTAQ